MANRAGVTAIPKGLHHLEVTTRSKFAGKWPSRLPHSPVKFVQPVDRIRRWNIRPDDRVRLLVGTPAEKYRDESEGSKGGYKVYKVLRVDLHRNRLYLEGLTSKRSATSSPRPDNWASMSAEDRQTWESTNNVMPASRPVHYSNVQLCVEENGANSVFASRVSTGRSGFDKSIRRLTWARFASKLSGPSDIAADPDKGLVHIPWPKVAAQKLPKGELSSTSIKRFPKTAEPEVTDTLEAGTKPSLALPTIDYLKNETTASKLIPSASSSRTVTNQTWSDTYLDPAYRSNPAVDALMPMYLSEELSPRFSRAKQTKAWNDAREQRELDREEYAREAVLQWEAEGRDAGLTSILDSTGLSGIRVRGRTRQEVREGALAEFDQRVEENRKAVRVQRFQGKVFAGGVRTVDGFRGIWKNAEEVAARKRGEVARKTPEGTRKERQADKLERRLRNLKLEEGRNSVVPAEVRA